MSDVEIDVGALLSSLVRKLPYIIVFVGIVAVGTYFALEQIAPVYKSEASVIIESGESDLTRTNQSGQPTAVPDKEAVASQIQLIRSRDVAAAVAAKLDLKSRAEFDPSLAPLSTLDKALASIGLHSALSGSVDDRVLKAYFGKLDVYAVDQSRVIGIDFSSIDPRLAADAANAIADGYIALQRDAKRNSTTSAVDFLAGQIDDLRGKVVDAEGRVAAFRADNNLFAASAQPATTLPAQQLADLNGELSKARADRATAQAKADQIRAALTAGTPVNLPDVFNSPLMQGLIQQEVALKSQMAQLSATLLPQHPKMKELAAQVTDIDRQIAGETSKLLDALDGDARLAAAREAQINRGLVDLRTAATKAGAAGVQLAALEREAAAQRDLLDQYLRNYRQAMARDQADYLPADARVVSRASIQLEPDFPKKVPMTAAATVAAAILAVAVLLLSELASGRPMRRVSYVEPLRVGARAPPTALVTDRTRRSAEIEADDEHDGPALSAPASPKRIVPGEPTLAPALAGRIEQSLYAVAADVWARQAKRILVASAQDVWSGGRPLAALALARLLVEGRGRVALVDFSEDTGNATSIGEGRAAKGLADVFDGTASFSDVLFRDHRSRVHYVPAGSRVLTEPDLADERVATILSALTLTYDHVVLDAREEVIGRLGGAAGSALVVSQHAAADPRTDRLMQEVRRASPDSEVHLLIIDAAAGEDGVERAKVAAVA